MKNIFSACKFAQVAKLIIRCIKGVYIHSMPMRQSFDRFIKSPLCSARREIVKNGYSQGNLLEEIIDYFDQMETKPIDFAILLSTIC